MKKIMILSINLLFFGCTSNQKITEEDIMNTLLGMFDSFSVESSDKDNFYKIYQKIYTGVTGSVRGSKAAFDVQKPVTKAKIYAPPSPSCVLLKKLTINITNVIFIK